MDLGVSGDTTEIPFSYLMGGASEGGEERKGAGGFLSPVEHPFNVSLQLLPRPLALFQRSTNQSRGLLQEWESNTNVMAQISISHVWNKTNSGKKKKGNQS